MTTILKLTKGDKVRATNGRIGTVVAFTRDAVIVQWSETEALGYSDKDLRELGIAKVTPADALRPVKR